MALRRSRYRSVDTVTRLTDWTTAESWFDFQHGQRFLSSHKFPHRVWIPSGLLFNGCRLLSPLVQSGLNLRHITQVRTVLWMRIGGDRRLHGAHTNGTTFTHSFIQPLCETSCLFTPKCSYQNLSGDSEFVGHSFHGYLYMSSSLSSATFII